MSAPEAGWYDDGSGTMRWWDGTGWADAPPGPETPESAPAAAEEASASPDRRPRRKRVLIAMSAAAVAIVVIGVVTAFFVPRGAGAPAADPEPTPTESTQVEAVAEEAEEPDDGLLHPGDWDITGPAVEPADEAEQGAVAVVHAYDTAWETADCDAYMNATSPRWREALYIEDCETFAQVAASIEDSADEVTAALIKRTGPKNYIVGVVYTMPVTEGPLVEGATEPPVWRSLASFHVRERGGQWQVDEVHDLEDGREEWEMAPGERSESDRTLAQWEAAIVGGDCDALFASTTENFRSRSELVDCAALQAFIQERAVYCDLSVEPVESHYQTKWDSHHDEIIATVAETCLYVQDADGNALDPPQKGDPTEVEFHLVYDWDAGRWLIDNVG